MIDSSAGRGARAVSRPGVLGSDMAGRPAHELRSLVGSGAVSVREVVDAHLARIDEVDPQLNAVVVRLDDRARADADAADAARASGTPLGPLHGVPVTVKESLAVAGTAATAGLPGRRAVQDVDDDPWVARLRAAGAILVGKTNVAQLLLAYESVNPVHGRTSNPWNLDRTPGGSSGGEAAVVSVGGSAIGLGTDILGSVRIPAAFTGICAFKPTAGRTPDAGRLSIPRGQTVIVSQVGPLARTVTDLDLALQVLAPSRGTTDRGVAGTGVGVWTASPAGGTATVTASPAVARAVTEAAGHLAAAGAHVTDWAPPDVPDALATIFGILGADQARGLRRLVGRDAVAPEIATFYRGMSAGRVGGVLARRVLRHLGQDTALPTVAHAGRHHTHEYWTLVEAAETYRRRVADDLVRAGVSLIVAPAHAAPALRHGTGVYGGPGGLFSMLVNLLGYPAGVVPVTRIRDDEDPARGGPQRPATRDRGLAALASADRGSAGLPVGVQVIGLPGADDHVLAAMTAIETAVPAAVRTLPSGTER